ncbi:hypothetical protein QPL79_01070 [Ignisphaera sp. 4213-co]|uniref:AAA+ ATPase domain-containing protein n=1 Tax=Ignisphaera cupida TaxID=3050454 RepID=A0ABD4Z4N4_9CREN|nr:hypothetical protein [Ignisphaera sp. 4213-co]MDK6027957.1 hypothetical protein [Ignisphaera sp. 4213-co]
MLSTCNAKLDEILFSKPSKIIIYGIAGSGKTNFLLNILKCSKLNNSKIVFISTEDPVFLNRVMDLGIDSSNIYFAFALSQEHLLSLILESLKYDVVMVAIDSINHLYRVESESNKGINIFVNILVILDALHSKGITIVASAQVKLEENIVAGFEYLSLWADKIIELKILPNKMRSIKLVKPLSQHEYRFVITSKGIEWIHRDFSM